MLPGTQSATHRICPWQAVPTPLGLCSEGCQLWEVREVRSVWISLLTLYLVFRNPFCGLYVIHSCQSMTPAWERPSWAGSAFLVPVCSTSERLPKPMASCFWSLTDTQSSLMSCFILHLLLSTVQPHGTRQHLQPGHHAHHRRGGGYLRHDLCQIQLARAEGKWILSQSWSAVHAESLLCGNCQIIHR